MSASNGSLHTHSVTLCLFHLIPCHFWIKLYTELAFQLICHKALHSQIFSLHPYQEFSMCIMLAKAN